MQSSPMDVDKFFCLLWPFMRPLFDSPGVVGLLAELKDSVSVSRDGIDSVDRDRTDDNGPKVVSLSKLPLSSSDSSGGLRRRPQDWGLDEEIERLGISLNLDSCIFRRANENELRGASA